MLLDVQDKAMRVEDKLADDFATGARGEWFIVCGSLPDHALAHAERIQTLLADRFPEVRMSLDTGSVTYAVATVAVLADEASQDVDDALDEIGEMLGIEELAWASASCGRVGDEQPSGSARQVIA